METATSTSQKGHIDNQLQSKPISLIRSGRYHYSESDITDRNDSGYYWNLGARSDMVAGSIYFSNYVLVINSNTRYKNFGHSLRCLVR